MRLLWWEMSGTRTFFWQLPYRLTCCFFKARAALASAPDRESMRKQASGDKVQTPAAGVMATPGGRAMMPFMAAANRSSTRAPRQCNTSGFK